MQKKELKAVHKQKKDLKPGGEYLSGLAKEDRLHPVVCITFYHGEEPWDGPETLFDMVRFPEGYEDMKQYCSDFKMNLIHAWNVDPKNFRTGLGTAFELLPYTGNQKKMQEYVKKNEEHFSHLSEEGRKDGENQLILLAKAMRADGREEEFFTCCARENLRKNFFRSMGYCQKRSYNFSIAFLPK